MNCLNVERVSVLWSDRGRDFHLEGPLYNEKAPKLAVAMSGVWDFEGKHVSGRVKSF